MTNSMLDLLMPASGCQHKKVYGVVIGIVTNNEDRGGMGRVKVRFPWMSENDESAWARMAVPMARRRSGRLLHSRGGGRGAGGL